MILLAKFPTHSSPQAGCRAWGEGAGCRRSQAYRERLVLQVHVLTVLPRMSGCEVALTTGRCGAMAVGRWLSAGYREQDRGADNESSFHGGVLWLRQLQIFLRLIRSLRAGREEGAAIFTIL
jgi:hypothetical protein